MQNTNEEELCVVEFSIETKEDRIFIIYITGKLTVFAWKSDQAHIPMRPWYQHISPLAGQCVLPNYNNSTARGKWQRSWATHLASKCPRSKSAWAAFCETTSEWFHTWALNCSHDQCHSLHMSAGSKLWLIAVSYRCLCFWCLNLTMDQSSELMPAFFKP